MDRRLLGISLFILLTAGCGTVINGQIYLDENNNLNKEETEPVLAGVIISVNREGKAHGDVVTDRDGKFKLEIDPSKIEPSGDSGNSTEAKTPGKAKYCVKIQQASLISQAVAILPRPQQVQLAALETNQGTAGGSQQQSGQTASGGTTSGETTSGSQQGSGNEDQKKTTDEKADTSDSKTTTTDSGVKQQVGALEACREGIGVVEINVAVAPKYDKIIAKIAVPETKTMTVGERTNASVCYPVRCKLEPFALPEGLEPCGSPQGGLQFDVVTRQMTIPVDMPSSTGGSTGIPGGEIKCDPVCLQLNDRASGEIAFTPAAICPDDQTITLHKHLFKVEKQPELVVEHSILSGSLGLGQTVTVRALARNNSQRDLTGAKLIVELTGSSTIQSTPEGCNNLGQKIECMSNLAKGAEISKNVAFQLPAEINGDTTFKINTSFTPVSGAAVTATEISQTVVDPTPPNNNPQQ